METKICYTCREEKDVSFFPFTYRENNPSERHNNCKQCKSDNKSFHMRQNQLLWQTEVIKPFECSVCKYDRCIRAIEFHHKIPVNKEYKISDILKRYNPLTAKPAKIAFIKAEICKCILLCANCHREHHDDLLPVDHIPTISFEK